MTASRLQNGREGRAPVRPVTLKRDFQPFTHSKILKK